MSVGVSPLHARQQRGAITALLTGALLALFWVPGPRALAADPSGSVVEQVERLSEEAHHHHQAGDFAKAVGAYMRAHQLHPAAELLYNVAYIYDVNLQELALALRFYKRYVGAEGADPVLVERALVRVAEIKVLLEAKTRAEDKARADEKAQLQREAAARERAQEKARRKPPVARELPQVEVRAESGGGAKLAGWVTLGLGGASLVTGIALALVSDGKFADFAASTDLSAKQGLRDEGRALALAGDILIGAGAVAVVTGIIVVATSGSGGATTTEGVRVGARPTSGGGLLTLGGTL